MILEFLSNERADYMKIQSDVLSEIEQVDLRIHELQDIKDLMKEERREEEEFTAFSPRLLNQHKKTKYEEVKAELEGLEGKRKSLDRELAQVNGRIEMIVAAIQEVEDLSKGAIPSGVKSKIGAAISLLPHDPKRAKKNLQELLRGI